SSKKASHHFTISLLTWATMDVPQVRSHQLDRVRARPNDERSSFTAAVIWAYTVGADTTGARWSAKARTKSSFGPPSTKASSGSSGGAHNPWVRQARRTSRWAMRHGPTITC